MFFLSMTNCTQRRHLNFRSSFYECSWDSFLSKQTSFYMYLSWVSCAIFTYYCWLNCLESGSVTSFCVNYHRRKPKFILSIFETLCCVLLTNKLGILEHIEKIKKKNANFSYRKPIFYHMYCAIWLVDFWQLQYSSVMYINFIALFYVFRSRTTQINPLLVLFSFIKSRK